MVSVVIPTHKRYPQLAESLSRINECRPVPTEILVHVDYGDEETAEALHKEFPAVKLLLSDERMGPGGGRNRLIAAASSEIVVSFDDDSYPMDLDFFHRVVTLFDALPDASVIGGRIFDPTSSIEAAASYQVGRAALFVGCGVAYRRNDFLELGGYVPLPVAYGMEELDLCLRMWNADKRVYFSPALRVFHATDLTHHSTKRITAGSIMNVALLAYLRYPLVAWPYAVAQLGNRIFWLIAAGRNSGILEGLAGIPGHLWRHRHLRSAVGLRALREFNLTRRREIRLEPIGSLGVR